MGFNNESRPKSADLVTRVLIITFKFEIRFGCNIK